MRQYRYNPLFQEGQAIRVLQLLPSKEKSSILRGEIIEYLLEDLDATNHVSEMYEALSYAWGGEKKPKSIIITDNQNDGSQEVDSELSITQSLHDALLRLRHCQFPRILWVDAVCIDQTNGEEKEHQIQLMPLIYARAKCVLVWLGEAQDDSDMVLESIQAASRFFLNPPCDDTPTPQPVYDLRQAIQKLLNRPWFSRMWILQEIGAARHVAILCGSTEIEGHAFSLGLDYLMKTWKAPFCSVTFLMRGAVFRPRRLSKNQARFSLDICSLSELIDQYRFHETTIPHDKVYALLGMSSDDIRTAGLEPNYKLAWEELMNRLVKFLIGNRVSIDILKNTGIAIIKGKGCLLGSVYPENTTQGWGTEVTIFTSRDNSIKYCSPNLPQPIEPGDLLYLLEGAPEPIIIRPYERHFSVVAIGAVSRRPSQGELSNLVRRTNEFRRDIILAWDWKNRFHAYSLSLSSNPLEMASRLINFRYLWNVALVLKDEERLEERRHKITTKIFEEAAEECKGILEVMNLHIPLRDLLGLTPLAFAAKNGCTELADMLLAEDEKSLNLEDMNGQMPLSHAAQNGHVAVVRRLLESCRSRVIMIDDGRQTPLLWAASYGQEEVVKLLLKTDQINVNAKDKNGWSALSKAAKNGHESVVNLLLDVDQIDVNTKFYCWTPLLEATERGWEGVAWRLLEMNQIDVNTKTDDCRDLALVRAVERGQEDMVKLLLKADNIDVNAGAFKGWTLLSRAAELGHELIVKILLDNKASVDLKDKRSMTPLLLAAKKGHVAIVKILLDNNAVVDSWDRDGRRPLSLAAERGHEVVVKILLDNKADVDLRDRNGRTALSYAVERRREAVARVLLDNKVEVNAEDRNGRTPLSIAEDKGHEAIIKLLRGEDAWRWLE